MKRIDQYSILLFSLLSILVLNGCIQSEQTYSLNQNGAGKIRVSASLMGNMKFSSKEDQNTHEDTVKMLKTVKKIVQESKGIEAWDSLEYGIGKDGKINFSGVAYFPDITKLDLEEIPIVPVTSYDENELKWGNSPSDQVSQKLPGKSSKTNKDTLSTEERIEKIRNEFNESKQILKVAMNMFEIKATFRFPYKIKSTNNIEQTGDRRIKFKLEGDKILKGFESLIEDDEKMTTLIEEKGVKQFDFNNPHILKAAYPNRSFMSVKFKSGFLSPSPQDPVDYEKAVAKLDPKIPEIEVP